MPIWYVRMNVIVHALHSIESNIEKHLKCEWQTAAGRKTVYAIGSVNMVFT